MVKNQKSNESQVFDLDIISSHPMPARLEVSTSLGIHLASVVIKEELIQISIPKQKKFYEGVSSRRALQPLLKVNIEPKLISAAIYQESFPDWNCRADNAELVSCQTPDGDEITWQKIDAYQRRVNIRGNGFEAQIHFKSYQKKSDLNATVFNLTPETDYKTYKLK